MVDKNLFSSLEKRLAETQGVLIILPTKPAYDQTAAALSLFLSLKKAERNPTIFCPSLIKVEASDLVGVNKIINRLPGQNLIVTIDVENSVDKVSYHLEGEKLKLVIKPKEGQPPLDPKKVHFSYTGGGDNLVILVGLPDPASGQDLTADQVQDLRPENTLLLGNKISKKVFAKYDLSWDTDSVCEVAAYLLNQFKLPVDKDIAANLFKGLDRSTRSFTSSRVSATTFEAAAFCFRAGVRRTVSKANSEDIPEEVTADSAKDTKDSKSASQPDWLEPQVYSGARI